MEINIFSGQPGLGGALTNPTELARRKGTIIKGYPVVVAGTRYPDAEAAYQALKCGDAPADDRMMADIICLKFLQNPDLMNMVREMGGAGWLQQCSHFTGAKTPSAQAWEGAGMHSRFIRNLVAGYTLALEGRVTEPDGQQCLF